MYRYPNQEHYLNSLQRGAMLDQHVVTQDNQQLFVTKRKGVRQAVPFNAKIPKKPNQKVYTGAVKGPDGKIWFVDQGNTGFIHPAYTQRQHEAGQRYLAQIGGGHAGAKHPPGKPKAGQAHAKPGQAHEGKKHKPEIKNSPYKVLEKTKAILEHLRNHLKSAQVPESKVKSVTAEALKRGPYNFDALHAGLQKFVDDFEHSRNVFTGRNPAAVLGKTLTDVASEGLEQVYAMPDFENMKAADISKDMIKTFSKLAKNIEGALRGVQTYKDNAKKKAKLVESVKWEARVDGETLEEVVENATDTIIRNGRDDTAAEVDHGMKLKGEVLLRVAVKLVQNLFTHLQEGEGENWSSFVRLAAARPKLLKFVLKHEVAFKKAVDTAKAIKSREALKAKREAAKEAEPGKHERESPVHDHTPSQVRSMPARVRSEMNARFVSMRCASPSLDDL